MAGMQGNGRRRTFSRNGVVAGSVWEARMRVDAVNGGIKVFTGDESPDAGDGNADEEGMRVYRRLRRNQSDSIAAARKRRIWTPPQPAPPTERSPIQLRKPLPELVSSPRYLAGNSQELGGEKRVLAVGDGTEAAGGDDGEVEVGIEAARKSFDDKEMDLPVEKGKSVEVEEEKTINQVHEIPVSSPIVEKKQTNPEIVTQVDAKTNNLIQREIDPDLADPPASKLGKKLIHSGILPSTSAAEKKMINHRSLDPNPVEMPPLSGKKMNHGMVNPDPVEASSFDGARKMFDRASRNHSRMQSIVDLVMWRDVSKTAFVFGLGTFFLISSSYAKDLNFSFISAASYLGLIYLALIFCYKSILRRGENMYCDERDESYMVGEEEAIWLLRLLLPYLNELLFKMRALFSGDPATTMKLAVLLFVMARCGSSITIWTLSKLTFFGVFTVPKICTSYSTQLARIGKFWLERIRDGWESCTHKKAIAAAIFTLIWNISSTMARIWAVFMLVVALKYYQQCVAEDWSKPEEEVVVEEVEEVSKAGQRQRQVLGLQHRHRGGVAKRDEAVVRERKIKKVI
ncbi:reticulon-like protein B21 isoform X2 [Canna indica]|uniref:Reticulon-like protein n=1 Tax=Canna indica TaxID=4628 RepID=A0AAQ3Q844_9LILI|nr:reticulon-like protein B21 isoform X2 [Canna indica]